VSDTRTRFLASRHCALRFLLCAITCVLTSASALPQGTCSSTSYTIWGMSGYAGPNWLAPGSDPSWQQSMASEMANYGGVPSCTYTEYIDNPTTGAGHWYGSCNAYGYTCTGAPSPWPNYPTNFPNLPCTECEAQAGQPVNLTNGNVWVAQQDYSLPGLGGGITLQRTWNSYWSWARDAMPQSGMFGDSWRSTYEENLLSFGTDYIKYFRSNGDGWLFKWNSSTSSYQLMNPPNRHATLTYNGTTTLYTITFADGSSRVFSNSGHLISLADRNNNQTTVSFDTSGRISTITDAASRTLTFAYANTSFPNVATSAADSTGTVATYTYDSSGRLTNVTYPDSSQLNMAYDSNNLITSVTDAASKVIESHTYTSWRAGATCQRAGGADAVTIAYSTGYTTLTDSKSNSTTYNFSPSNGANFITAVSGNTCSSCGATNAATYAVDLNGNRTAVTDANGNTTNNTFDSMGNLLTRSIVVSGSTLTWTYTYNALNEVLTATDPLGHTTTNTYDSAGNLLTTTTPSPGGTTAGSVTTFTYDTKGQLLTAKDPLNNTTTMAYTAAGLISTITDAQSKVTTYTYDARANRLTVKDALNNTTTYTYDAMNRLTQITYPDTTTTQFAYDTRGRRTSVTDGNSKTTTYAYDDADRLTSVTDAASNATSYAYDTENNLTGITDANSHATSFTYNANRWLTRTTFPSTLTENYTYDLNGNLKTKTDRKSQTITYTYDQLNRLTQKTYPDSSTVAYTYDNASRLTQVVDPTGTYSFAFDNMGRLTGTTTAYAFLTSRNFTTGYAYDAASNRTSFTDPESGSTSYAYDTLNRLSTLTPPSAFTSSGNFGFTYDALSRRTQMTRPNGLTTNYTYDNLSRLLSVLHQVGTTTLDGAVYTVDNVGNRTAKTDKQTNVTTNYGYDAIYQLASATQGSTTTESYSYDPVGNRTASLGVSSYTTNSSNQLTATPTASYTYDNNGNTLTKTIGTNTTTYGWDYENQLTSVTLPASGGTVSFKYDPLGRRIYKSSPAVTSIFAYDGENLAEETSSSGSVVARYANGRHIDELLEMIRSSSTLFYNADALATVTSLSNGTGGLSQTYSYDAYGTQTGSSGSATNLFRFTGRELDTETALNYYRARYYDPAVGRFLSEDPEGFGGGDNFYAYVANNPSLWNDPFGLCKTCGIAQGATYNVSGRIKPGSSFAFSASFMNDETHDPNCCDVTQEVWFSRGPLPSGFKPPEDQPRHWYEDRDRNAVKVYRRSAGNSFCSQYVGDSHFGCDNPMMYVPVLMKLRLVILDNCRGGIQIYVSKPISEQF
jgi:RHS repeat-associated protein